MLDIERIFTSVIVKTVHQKSVTKSYTPNCAMYVKARILGHTFPKVQNANQCIECYVSTCLCFDGITAEIKKQITSTFTKKMA